VYICVCTCSLMWCCRCSYLTEHQQDVLFAPLLEELGETTKHPAPDGWASVRLRAVAVSDSVDLSVLRH
jgi:hypothetical protein